jgi:hypothetical protein
MSKQIISADHLLEKNYNELLGRLQTQFSDAADASKCLQEIEHRFRGRMDYHYCGSNAEMVRILMITVGEVSSKMLAEKSLRHENRLLNRIKRQASQTFREGVNFRELAFKVMDGFRVPRLRQQPAVR